MDLAGAGAVEDLAHVRGPDAAAGHNRDVVASSLDESREAVEGRERRAGAAAGQHARDATVDQHVEGGVEVAGGVEGAVEHDRRRRDGGHELAERVGIDVAVGRERAPDDAHGAGVEERARVVAHGRVLGVAERPPLSVAADHRHDRHVGLGHELAHPVDRRRQPAGRSVAAQLDAVGAGLGGDASGRQLEGGDFERGGRDWHRAGDQWSGGRTVSGELANRVETTLVDEAFPTTSPLLAQERDRERSMGQQPPSVSLLSQEGGRRRSLRAGVERLP